MLSFIVISYFFLLVSFISSKGVPRFYLLIISLVSVYFFFQISSVYFMSKLSIGSSSSSIRIEIVVKVVAVLILVAEVEGSK